MKRVLIFFTIIFLFSSCSQAATMVVPTAPIAPTATTAPTPTQEVDAVEQLLTAHLAGESIDVSSLSATEFREFSTQLAEQRNSERGVNPVIYNGEAYLDPNSYRLMDYDGHPDMNETIQMYLPVVGKDGDGNLQIVNHDGAIVTIDNSADVDWNMRVTDPNDPRIEWPKTEVYDGGYTEAQHRVNLGYTLFPAILLDKDYGIIFLEGASGGQGGWEKSIWRFLLIETDQLNNPILAREILVMGGVKMYRYEEGLNLGVPSGITVERDYLEFQKNMPENCVYYLAGNYDEVKTFGEKGMNVTMDNYFGLIYGNEAFNLINNTDNKIENKADYILFANTILIKKTK